MAHFLDDNFLLSTNTAKILYNKYAKDAPIIDYHCHVSPKEIWEDKRFESITQLWLGSDLYKWRLMRSGGIDEYYITGDAPDREKFLKFASVLPLAIGNPMYHWCHLELKNYFGYDGILNSDTAEEVYELCNARLAKKDMSVRGIIKQSGVEFIGTTDDPVDDLKYHELLSKDESFKTVVAPSFRPDKALNIDKDGWCEYIARLSDVCGYEIDGFDTLKRALADRIEYFVDLGCRASDHGLDRMVYTVTDADALEAIFHKGINGEAVSESEAEAFKTELLVFSAKEYARRGMVMQLHYNCLRNPNSAMFKKLGADSGFDCIAPANSIRKLSALFDRLYSENSLPRTVVYSLDPTDNASIDALIGAFQGTDVPCRIQHGSAWWFNDNKTGMREQLISFANLSLLGEFVGMLTDSRSFLSYARHEYFRRILCSLIGEWVEGGEYPNDEKMLGEIVLKICCSNAKRYFDI